MLFVVGSTDYLHKRCSNLPDQVMLDFDKSLGDQTLVEWEVLTYWCRCSTLWKRPSHGRRLRVRPVRSPGTDIWCCAAVSSRGRMSLSSWLLGESFYRDISRISSVPTPPSACPLVPNWCALDIHHTRCHWWLSSHRSPAVTRFIRPSMLPDLTHPNLPVGSSRPDLDAAHRTSKRARWCTNTRLKDEILHHFNSKQVR